MNRRMAMPVVVLATAVTGLSAGLLTLPAHGASADRQVISGTVPSWARATASDGAVSNATALQGRVYLRSQDPAGLTAFATAVSTPGNAAYHQYLTAAQMMSRFGPSAGAAQRVVGWLRSSHLTITRTSPNQIAFTGTTAAIDAAFRTQIDTYRVGGKSLHAPATPLTVPKSIGADVLGVYGLSSQLQGPRPQNVTDNGKASSPTAGQVPVLPCSGYFGEKQATKYPKAYGKVQPYAVCGYEADQLRGAYGVTDKQTGKGVTVAITDVGALPTMAKDAQKWSKLHGVQQFKKGQYKEYVEPGAPYNPGWAGEESLDVESVHGMAPDANVAYFGIATDFTWAFDQIVDKHMARCHRPSSWTTTAPRRGVAGYEQDAYQMGTRRRHRPVPQPGDGSSFRDNALPVLGPVGHLDRRKLRSGITESRNGCSQETGLQVNFLHALPRRTSRSWTPAPPGNFQSGSGGGTSTTYKQPSWQKGVVPKQFSEQYGKTPMRTTPDIGAEADPTTGFLQGYSSQVGGKFVYGEDRIGGTSLSSPLLAGMTADAIQADGGTAIGFANQPSRKPARVREAPATSPDEPLNFRRSAKTDEVSPDIGAAAVGPACRKRPVVAIADINVRRATSSPPSGTGTLRLVPTRRTRPGSRPSGSSDHAEH